MNILVKALLGLFGLIVLLFGVAAFIYRDIPAEVLEAKYADPEASQFIELDGVRVHYRDEGSGVPVVLVTLWGRHGSSPPL